MDPKLHSRKGTCFAFPRCPAGTHGAEEPAQAALSLQRRAREHTWSRLCAWTRLGSSCSSHVAWHAPSWVRSQPIPQQGPAGSWGWSSRAPNTQQPALPFGAAHCSIVARLVFPEMHPRGAIRSQGKGARTFLATHRSCRGSARSWGSRWASQQAKGKSGSQLPKPGLCLAAQLQELLSLCRALFANPAAELPCPGTSSSFLLHQQILNNRPGGLGWGKDPAGGAGKYLWDRRLSEENSKVASGKGSSLHTGRLFLIRACLDWSHPHCTSTSTPRSQPGASCSSQRDRGAALTQRGQELTLGLPIPPQRAWGDPQASRVLPPGVPPSFPAVRRLRAPRAAQPGPVTCPQHRPWAAEGHRAAPRLSAPSLPSLAPAAGAAKGAAGTKRHFFQEPLPAFPPPSQSRAAMLGSAGGSWIRAKAVPG